MKYSLEIYEPGSCDTPAAAFQSSSPFLPMAPGDLVNPAWWEDQRGIAAEGDWTLLRVVSVEHLVGKDLHKIMVFTKSVPDKDDTRFAQRQLDLSLKDRLMLFNQYLILEKLCPEDARGYANLREALSSGYVLEYGRLVGPILDEFSEEDCREVYDILEMYRDLHYSHEQAGIAKGEVQFNGFDGNHETEQMGYTRYLLENQGLYEELHAPTYNSHARNLPRYRAMLREWKAIRKRKEPRNELHLTKEEIEQIVAARRTSRKPDKNAKN